jgi:hypothetical protein
MAATGNSWLGPSIDASYQVSVHLAKLFQMRRFKKIGQSETRIAMKETRDPRVLSVFSSPCQRQCELLPSLRVRRPLTFRILIFSSETPHPNELVC